MYVYSSKQNQRLRVAKSRANAFFTSSAGKLSSFKLKSWNSSTIEYILLKLMAWASRAKHRKIVPTISGA